MYGVRSLVSTYYTSSSRTTDAISLIQNLFPSQAAFDDTVERSVQSRLDVVRLELCYEYDHQCSDLRIEICSELHCEYDQQVGEFQRELETLTRWAHNSGMRPPLPPSDAEGDTGPDHTTDLGDQ